MEDRYNFVFVCFLLHGIIVLLPWNIFINVKDFYINRLHESGYEKLFLQYLTFASQCPNVLFTFFNILCQFRCHLNTRIYFSLGLQIIIMCVNIILSFFKSETWIVGFFYLLMFLIVIINMASAIYQNTLYGLAGYMNSKKYINAVIIGTNLSGLFSAICLIISDLISMDLTITVYSLFICVLVLLFIQTVLHMVLNRNSFYLYNKFQYTRIYRNDDLITIPIQYIFKKAKMQFFNIFITFFITCLIYPSIYAEIKPTSIQFLSEKHFTYVTCFLMYNLFAMLGMFYYYYDY